MNVFNKISASESIIIYKDKSNMNSRDTDCTCSKTT